MTRLSSSADAAEAVGHRLLLDVEVVHRLARKDPAGGLRADRLGVAGSRAAAARVHEIVVESEQLASLSYTGACLSSFRHYRAARGTLLNIVSFADISRHGRVSSRAGLAIEWTSSGRTDDAVGFNSRQAAAIPLNASRSASRTGSRARNRRRGPRRSSRVRNRGRTRRIEPVPQRLEILAVEIVREIHHAFASIVEFQPDLVVTEIPRIHHMTLHMLVTGQSGLHWQVDERAAVVTPLRRLASHACGMTMRHGFRPAPDCSALAPADFARAGTSAFCHRAILRPSR